MQNPLPGNTDRFRMFGAQVSAGAQDPGVISTITGWGNTSQGGQGSDVLQYIEVPIISANDPGLSNQLNINSRKSNCSKKLTIEEELYDEFNYLLDE